jgi:hypothetical protein
MLGVGYGQMNDQAQWLNAIFKKENIKTPQSSQAVLIAQWRYGNFCNHMMCKVGNHRLIFQVPKINSYLR